MVTLILEANRIPVGTKVHKVTGKQEYILQRELKIYIDGDNRVVNVNGIVFLTSESSINGYQDTTKFAVDLEERDAIELLESIDADNESK